MKKSITCLFLMCACFSINAKPYPVSTQVTIRNGDWYPLTEQEMKAAAVDSALAELTRDGMFSIFEKSAANKLGLEISLIGPAETAKMTIRLDLKGQPSYISTASISVHDMDYSGIYNAFEHIGKVAAQRLNDKTQALLIKPVAKPNKAQGDSPAPDDKALQAMYDDAQKLKRQYQYQKSRILFEQVAAASDEASGRLSELAKDELRYGLTVFEAKQSIVSMGNGDAIAITRSIRNAENLYRQILAENSDSLARTQEAQAALDNLSVTRNALKNVLRAQTMMAANSVRMMMQEQYMMTGECPGQKDVSRFISDMRSELTIKSVEKSAKGTHYSLTDDETGNPFMLSCADQRVSVIN